MKPPLLFWFEDGQLKKQMLPYNEEIYARVRSLFSEGIGPIWVRAYESWTSGVTPKESWYSTRADYNNSWGYKLWPVEESTPIHDAIKLYLSLFE